MDWVHAQFPRFDDRYEFEVWLASQCVRRVRRIGNHSTYFAPGTLVFTDCTHPMQNALCNEADVRAWRVAQP